MVVAPPCWIFSRPFTILHPAAAGAARSFPLQFRALSSVVERHIDIVKAEGPIPSGRTRKCSVFRNELR